MTGTEVRAGELVLLPRNDAHSFGSDLGIAPTPARDVIQPPEFGAISRIKYGGNGGATQLLCGFLGSQTPFSPLLSSLPEAAFSRVFKRQFGTSPCTWRRQSA
nr:cupin domain-containing protein [Pseudomonas sp. GM74]